MHRGSGATIRCVLVVIGVDQGDGGVGSGLRACGEVEDGSGTTFRPAGARGGSVRWAYGYGALCGYAAPGGFMSANQAVSKYFCGHLLPSTVQNAVCIT